MGMRAYVAMALGAAILVAALASPVPASNPAPAPAPNPASSTAAVAAPTLAPLDDGEPDAGSTPAPSTSPGQPKVLGHIYTSAFCTNFVEHFNIATRIVLGNDQNLTSVDHTLRAVEDDWNRTDGAMRVYSDRLALIDSVGKMMRSIPASQAAVNALLAQAKVTTDPARKAALLESTSQLQKTIDRQRAVAYDLSNVIHVLLDKHKADDTGEYNIARTLPPGEPPPRISLLDDPVPEPGTQTMMQPAPSPSPGVSPTPRPGSVEDVMQWTRQRWIISTAESSAAVAASKVVRICSQESVVSPPPSP